VLPLTPWIFRFFLSSIGLAAACLNASDNAPTEWSLRDWHEAAGLPADETASVMLDEHGYLWVTTSSGLARFDGTTFEKFKMPAGVLTRGTIYAKAGTGGELNGLIALASVATDSEGAPLANGNGFYVGKNGAFDFVTEPKLTGKIVRSVFSEEEGILWLGCEDGTLLCRHGSEATVYTAPVGIAGKKIPGFATDGDKHTWVVIGNFLARVEGARLAPVSIDREEPELRIASSRTGGPWVFTRTAVLKWTDGKLEEIAKLPELLGAHFIQTALEDRSGHLWIGTRSQGLFRLTGEQVIQVPTSSTEIASLCEDNEGDLWVATDGGGLDRLRPQAHRLFDQASGLKDNYSYTVAEDSDGAIWLANRDGGVARIKEGEVDLISRRAGWRSFSAMSVFPIAGGGMWITSGIGVYRTDAVQAEKVFRVQSLNNFKGVRSTFVARNGDYWLSFDPDRVARLRGAQVTIFGPSEGLDAHEIRAIAEDAAGKIWLGASDGKLFRSADERFEHVPFQGAEKCGALQALRFEADGTLLIGTTRHGIAIVPPAGQGPTRTLGTEQGLPGDNITQILADDFDRTWFASRSGVFWVHRSQIRDFIERKTEHVHAIMLGRDDGVPDLSCLGLFQPAAWKAKDGKLWFATRRGVLRTEPALVSGNDNLPPVIISWVRCDGRAQPAADELKIPSTVRKTEIGFSALSLSAPERILVRYRLDGFDNDWVLQHTGRVAAYPRLPPGNYLFHVMASNGAGVWSDSGAELKIMVVPRWWQSWWAQLLYLLGLILIVTAIVRGWMLRRLHRRLERLKQGQAVERERTRIARNIHDDLGASLTRISLLTQSAQNQNPALAAKFEEIYATAHAITRSMDEIVWAVNPKCDDVENLVYYVGNFAQTFLGSAGIRCRLELPKELPAIPLTSQVRHNLFLCCKEALNNVAKHARATEVTITITVSQSTLQITVTDNGRGIAAAGKPAASPAKPGYTSGGNGLKNMRARMTEMGGDCTISTQFGAGTVVTFTIALPSHTS
jgi:signal transduction histidine kinase/ligand-binding sensor domain-containing protein